MGDDDGLDGWRVKMWRFIEVGHGIKSSRMTSLQQQKPPGGTDGHTDMPCTKSESCCSGGEELPAGTSEPMTQPPCESHTLSTSQGCCADGRSSDGEEARFLLLVPWTDALPRCMHPHGCNARMPEFLWTTLSSTILQLGRCRRCYESRQRLDYTPSYITSLSRC